MGFAGNAEPQFVIPTALTTKAAVNTERTVGGRIGGLASGIEDLDFETGFDAVSQMKSNTVSYPIRHGQVENWDWMESYWQHCIFKYLRCDPESHYFMLTEPPLNAPENREYTAEIMFETFNVPGLYIAVQAVLALAASWGSSKVAKQRKDSGLNPAASSNPLTGIVVDSGDGVTHVIPVVEGYAIGSAIKHIPIAGRDVTHYVQQLLRDRNEANLPPDQTLEVAKKIKEQYTYVAPNLAREFAAFDAQPTEKFISFEHMDTSTKKLYQVEVGYEQFIAPEIFFNPELLSSDHVIPLPELVDGVVQACPLDSRRDLYANIVLSGGSTLFKDFSRRLQRDMRQIVDNRLSYVKGLSSNTVNTKLNGNLDVNVFAHEHQRYAVFSGGSLLASMDQFPAYCHTKAEYDEVGPSLCRQSRVFNNLFI